MRSSFASRSGARLAKSPSHRHDVAARWLAAAGGMLALAIASGLVGMLATAGRPAPPSAEHTGPFSYFPTQ